MKKKIALTLIALIITGSLFASGFGLGVTSGYATEYLKYNGDNVEYKLDEGTATVPVSATMHFNMGKHFGMSLNGGATVYLPEEDGDETEVGANASAALYFRLPVGSFMDINLGAGAGYEYQMIDSASFELAGQTFAGDISMHTVDVFATIRPVFNFGEHFSFFGDAKVGIDVFKQMNAKSNIGVEYHENLLEDDIFGWKWSAQAGIMYRF